MQDPSLIGDTKQRSMAYSTPGFPEDDPLAIWAPSRPPEQSTPARYKPGIPGRSRWEAQLLDGLEDGLRDKIHHAADSFVANFLPTQGGGHDIAVAYTLKDLQSEFVNEKYRLSPAEGKSVEATLFRGDRAHQYGVVGQSATALSMLSAVADVRVPDGRYTPSSLSSALHPNIRGSQALIDFINQGAALRAIDWANYAGEQGYCPQETRFVAGRSMHGQCKNFATFATGEGDFLLNDGTAHFADRFFESGFPEKPDDGAEDTVEAETAGTADQEGQSPVATNRTSSVHRRNIATNGTHTTSTPPSTGTSRTMLNTSTLPESTVTTSPSSTRIAASSSSGRSRDFLMESNSDTDNLVSADGPTKINMTRRAGRVTPVTVFPTSNTAGGADYSAHGGAGSMSGPPGSVMSLGGFAPSVLAL